MEIEVYFDQIGPEGFIPQHFLFSLAKAAKEIIYPQLKLLEVASSRYTTIALENVLIISATVSIRTKMGRIGNKSS